VYLRGPGEYYVTLTSGFRGISGDALKGFLLLKFLKNIQKPCIKRPPIELTHSNGIAAAVLLCSRHEAGRMHINVASIKLLLPPPCQAYSRVSYVVRTEYFDVHVTNIIRVHNH
jgi:hypothetical protein